MDGGLSVNAIRNLYLPAARLLLDLNRIPHNQIDPQAGIETVQQYLQTNNTAKNRQSTWLRGLEIFRRFLLLERGEIDNEPITKDYDLKKHTKELPEWLVTNLKEYLNLARRNMNNGRSEARQHEAIGRFWSGHLRIWRFLCTECGLKQLQDLRAEQVQKFIDKRLDAQYSESGINTDLRGLRGFLLFLYENGQPISPTLLRIQGLKQPDSLPKYLTDGQVQQLNAEMERAVCGSQQHHQRLDAVQLRAAFLLMWQAGLRMGEVLELHLEDLDLSSKRLIVRNGKGLKDRPVYLSSVIVCAIQAYLAMRGNASSGPLFVYRHAKLKKDRLQRHLKTTGERVGIKVHCHRLRHTFASQLLNAGCRITSIQHMLGHTMLNTTMIYARAYDETIANDYFRAIAET